MKKTVVFSITIVFLFIGSVYADTFGSGVNQFTIDFVDISGDTNPTSGYGIVNNDYRIGTYEVTNDQWAMFKTAYGAVDGSPSNAYDGNPYFIASNVPTNNASWYEAAQFVNWLNTSTNHQAAYKFTGTQGQSDYTFTMWDITDTDGTNLYRHKDARYFLPTEHEWVKAAYWNGTTLQTYATTDDSMPIAGIDTNCDGAIGNPWDVGSGTIEQNGTFDMMGNVYEWMESPWATGDYMSESNRTGRGGVYNDSFDRISSLQQYRLSIVPDYESSDFGFRVASIPEPTTLLLLGMGGLLIRKRQLK